MVRKDSFQSKNWCRSQTSFYHTLYHWMVWKRILLLTRWFYMDKWSLCSTVSWMILWKKRFTRYFIWFLSIHLIWTLETVKNHSDQENDQIEMVSQNYMNEVIFTLEKERESKLERFIRENCRVFVVRVVFLW